MRFLRKILVGLLSLVLFICLIALGIFISFKLSFGNQSRVDNWLSTTPLYSSFTAEAVSRAQVALGSYGSSPAVVSVLNQGITTALPKASFNQDVGSIVNANYKWLSGNTAIPQFSIDLTGAKQNLTNAVNQYVSQKLNSLPACTKLQLLQIKNQLSDPLSLPCRPPQLSVSTVADQISGPINTAAVFSSGGVITAQNINGLLTNKSEPYFVRLSKLPKYYQLAAKLPVLLLILVIISGLGILFGSEGKRLALRRLAWVLVLSGLSLLIIRLAYSKLTLKLDNRIAASSTNNYQPPIKDFVHAAFTYMARVDQYIAASYILLAVILFIFLILIRHKPDRATALETPTPPVPQPSSTEDSPKAKNDPDEPRPPRRLIQ